MIFDYFEFSNSGGRDYNEDCVGAKLCADGGIFLVADGLGGLSLGEVASQTVRNTLIDKFDESITDMNAWITDTLKEANDQLLAIQAEKNKKMKSTVVMLTVKNGDMTFAHAGDSRLYYLHNNELTYFTEDHSVAYKKYKAGEIKRTELGKDEDQSSLLRSIGGEDHNEPTIYNYPDKITPGDAFMLCSDGAWEYLKDAEVLIDRLKSRSAKEWTERLLLRIMDRVDGTNDNLSVVTLIVE